MMNIHQTIHDTMDLSDDAVMALTGAGDVSSVVIRRDKMRLFLKFNKWELKEYKTWLLSGAWTPKNKPRGAGDKIARITSAMGLKSCGGCKKRQKKLNQMFPSKG